MAKITLTLADHWLGIRFVCVRGLFYEQKWLELYWFLFCILWRTVGQLRKTVFFLCSATSKSYFNAFIRSFLWNILPWKFSNKCFSLLWFVRLNCFLHIWDYLQRAVFLYTITLWHMLPGEKKKIICHKKPLMVIFSHYSDWKATKSPNLLKRTHLVLKCQVLR